MCVAGLSCSTVETHSIVKQLYVLVTQSCLTVPPHGLQPRLLCPQNSPGNTGVGFHFLLQGTFPTEGSNPDLLPRTQILYHLSHRDHNVVQKKGVGVEIKNPVSLFRKAAFENTENDCAPHLHVLCEEKHVSQQHCKHCLRMKLGS